MIWIVESYVFLVVIFVILVLGVLILGFGCDGVYIFYGWLIVLVVGWVLMW